MRKPNVFRIVRMFTNQASDDGWEVDEATAKQLGGMIHNYLRKGYTTQDIEEAVRELSTARDPNGLRYPVNFLGQFLGEEASKSNNRHPERKNMSNPGYFSTKRPELDANKQDDDPADKVAKAYARTPDFLLKKKDN